MIIKNAVTSFPINELISQRWSPRVFDPTKIVERDKLISICEAGRWAPSSMGDEPWRFIIWDKNHNIEDFNQGFECLGDWNQKWAKNAPILILALSDSKFRKNNAENRWAQFDTGAACQNFYLQSVELGLIAHPMGGFDVEKTKKTLNIPVSFTPMVMIAIGYQSDDLNLVDLQFQNLEQADRVRRSLGDNFFDGQWGNSIL